MLKLMPMLLDKLMVVVWLLIVGLGLCMVGVGAVMAEMGWAE